MKLRCLMLLLGCCACNGRRSTFPPRNATVAADAAEITWVGRTARPASAVGGGGEHGSMAGSLLTKWKDVAEKPEHLDTDSSRKLANCWQLLQSISNAAGALPQRPTDTAAAMATKRRTGRMASMDHFQ
jgi:hypothetical protein